MSHPGALQIWTTLQSAIKSIQTDSASLLSFEELYRKSYNLVLNKHGDVLYEGVEGEVGRYLKEVGERIKNVDDDRLLSERE